MIIDRTWNKYNQQLSISYLDEKGNRKMWQRYLHHISTYEYDKDGDMMTWDGKKCRKVFKDSTQYSPNEFDMLEFIYNLDDETKKEFEAMRFPRLYTWDIETEISDEFPEPSEAKQRVTAISVVGPDLSCIVYGLKGMDLELFKERYLDFIHNNHFANNMVETKRLNPKALFQQFHSEEDMLRHFLTKILPKIGCLAGWNSYRFDWQYIINRCIRLFGVQETRRLIKIASPTNELDKVSWNELNDDKKYSVMSPKHMMIWDYMELVKDYEYSLRPYESYSLDWVAEHGVGANKIKYDGSLQDLYEKDPEWYYFYNAVDSLLVMLIHYRFKCINSPCSMGTVTLVPAMKSMGQVALTTANLFKRFFQEDKHVVWDYDSVVRQKVEYEGAFCGCVPGRHEYCVCDDFASLYPSTIITCNLGPENIVKNMVGPDSLGRYVEMPWSEKELDEFRKDPNYFVSVMGTVYKNDKEYAFSRMQREQKELRNKYKYLNWKVQGELMMEIDRLIKEKEGEKKVV